MEYEVNIKINPSFKSQKYYQLPTQGVLDYWYIIQEFHLFFIIVMLEGGH